MEALPSFAVPLPLQLPGDFEYPHELVSIRSSTTAFVTSCEGRDRFLGRRRCIVCGQDRNLQSCHIIGKREKDKPFWATLKENHWVSPVVKGNEHEPRNGLSMCANHHLDFDKFYFFIRYIPQVKKYILVNFSDQVDLRAFHGKAVALDKNDLFVPFPSLFILHEVRVKADNPFQATPDIDLNSIVWQDWILSDGVYDENSNFFKRDAPPGGTAPSQARRRPVDQLAMTSPGGEASGGFMSAMIGNDEIAAILAETRAMPTWRACEMENIGWSGTTEENIKKYVERVGVEYEDD